jgi:hypothetical protein
MLSSSPSGPHVLECLACACGVPATIAVMLFAPSSVLPGRDRDPARVPGGELLVADQTRICAPPYLQTRLLAPTTSWRAT